MIMGYSQRGITLLLAILILASVLSIALGIFNVILIELKINQNARESYKAFYNALTGLECAQYYHVRATGTIGKSFWDPDSPPCSGTPTCTITITCNGQSIIATLTDLTGDTMLCDPSETSAGCKKLYEYKFSIPNTSNPLQFIAQLKIQAMRFTNIISNGSSIKIESFGRSGGVAPVNRTILFCKDDSGSTLCSLPVY